MKQIIQVWEKEINETTELVKTNFGDLNAEKLNWKSNAQTWSIAENLDHLIKTNESYYPIIKAIRSGNQHLPFLAKFSIITNFFGNLIAKSVSPDRKKKVKTFPVWEPAKGNISADIVAKFTKHQQELIAFINNAEDLLDKQTLISSPANKMIVYKLEKAFDILVSHEKRHFNQALEVLEKLPA